jgi:hypothetical protein
MIWSLGLCVRGLLCNDCNQVVARYERCPEFLTGSRHERLRDRGVAISAYLAAQRIDGSPRV